MKYFLIILVFVSSQAFASVGSETMTLLKKYHWFTGLENYIKIAGNPLNPTDHEIRRSVAIYLESVGLYDTGNASECKIHDKNVFVVYELEDFQIVDKKFCIEDSPGKVCGGEQLFGCGFGTAKQNINFLKALKDTKTQKHLLRISVSNIVKGENNLFLHKLKRAKCTTQLCRDKLAKEIKLMESL